MLLSYLLYGKANEVILIFGLYHDKLQNIEQISYDCEKLAARTRSRRGKARQD